MKFMLTPELIGPFIISNALAVWILWLSFRKADVARRVLAIFFFAAAGFNIFLSFTNPSSYLEFGRTSVFSLYQHFILGVFAKHITMIVSAIAVGQLFIATSMLLDDLRFGIGCIGGIIFGLAIAPLGQGSAFPSSIILSLAFAVLLLKKHTSKTAL